MSAPYDEPHRCMNCGIHIEAEPTVEWRDDFQEHMCENCFVEAVEDQEMWEQENEVIYG